MSETARNYDEEKCIVCGHTVRFYEDEYKKPCDYCGTWVFEKRKQSPAAGSGQKRAELLDLHGQGYCGVPGPKGHGRIQLCGKMFLS